MKKFALILVIFCLCVCTVSLQSFAAGAPLDEIQSIEIDARTSSDGVVTLRYDIAWKVLDSESEGPLTWVQIGVPNPYYEIVEYGGDAQLAYRFNSEEESKIRVDLKEEFSAGETAVFHFTIQQYCLVEPYGAGSRSNFMPGWFEDIAVKKLTVKWHPDNVESANAELQNDCYEWSGALEAGERFVTVTTEYGADVEIAYPPNDIESYISVQDQEDDSVLSVILFVILVGLIFFFTRIFRFGRYRGGRGFWYHGHIGGHGGGHSGCACAGCACACACAGGGRAGCAQKDFTSFEKLLKNGEKKETGDGEK